MSFFLYPWDTEPAPQPVPAVTAPEPDGDENKPKRRGRRPAGVLRARMPRAAAAADWLFHHLTVSGPAAPLENFAAAARGSGVTPWQLDFAAIEEDVFARAIAQPGRQRTLTVEGCRILARQFRERVEMRQARASEMVGHSFLCAFDLHALLPVPGPILQLGPTHPDALAWLAAHWGITDRLRQVVVRERATTGRRRPRGHAVIGYGFFTDGETPHAAVEHFTKCWPALRFWLVPRPAD
ncbi:MAG: hypothetical protein QOH67_4447 [Hyphomicrobiales bacterium]|nr:hypothetical protein [Hyphomicrobiales bacterium]